MTITEFLDWLKKSNTVSINGAKCGYTVHIKQGTDEFLGVVFLGLGFRRRWVLYPQDIEMRCNFYENAISFIDASGEKHLLELVKA